jgi:streptogramin lyase
MRRFAGLAVLAALAVLSLAPSASALTPTISEFHSGLSSGSDPFGIASGPGPLLSFADPGSPPALGTAATDGSITESSSGLPAASKPQQVTIGPDGNLWFTDNGSTPAIGRLAANGSVTEFHSGLHASSALAGITTGPDGNLWFTDRGPSPAIGRITPDGAIHEFSAGLDPSSSPGGIVSGPDGRLWFTDGGAPAIGRITTAGSIHEFSAGLNAGSVPAQIAAGPDGNLWFTDQGPSRAIGRMSTAGAVREFSSGLRLGTKPSGIAAGPDGALWFADSGATGAIGRITTSGSISEWTQGLRSGSSPFDVTAGPDGNIWFTDRGATAAIGRITTPPEAVTVSATAAGSSSAAVLGTVDGHAQATSFHVDWGPAGGALSSTHGQNLGTTIGPTHVSAALNHLRPNTSYQARIVADNPTDETAGALITFTTGPPKDRLTRFSLRPKAFLPASRGGSVARVSRAPGTIVTYFGSEPAVTTFTITRMAAGRRHGRRCVRPTRSNRRARTCTRALEVGSFTHADAVGRNRFRFTGRIGRRKLAPGDYLLTASPQSAGGVGRSVRKHFTILKPKPRKKHRHAKRRH